jgi:prepilin-type N-terminal cleavage/methylation domain-containing protein
MTRRPRPPKTQQRFGNRGGGGAFTLIELMVSLALVALLVLGINEVFRIASRGVSAGQALSTVQRDLRSGHAVMFGDLKNVVMPPNSIGGSFDNGPCFIIRSDRVYAFRNRQEHLADPNGLTTDSPADAAIADRDLNNNNVETDVGETTTPAIYNDRSHRIDQLLFFARGSFRRQTGGTVAGGYADPFVAPMGTAEALVWYGHLRQPDYGTPSANAGEQFVHRDPGEKPFTKNKDNMYAASWMLGRVQMLMRSPDATGQIVDNKGTAQDYMQRQQQYPNPPTGPALYAYYQSLNPFVPGVSISTGLGAYQLQWHRYDLAGISMDDFRDILFSTGTPADGKRGYHQLYVDMDPAVPVPFWQAMTGIRYQANPFPDRPVTALGVARTAPVFIRGCTQFIVEYAGDFVRQDNFPTSGTFGNVIVNDPATPVDPDGEIDYVVVNGQKQTRWYGMPRDTNGDGIILGWTTGRTNNQMPDVVPLQDVISSGLNGPYDPNAPGNTYTVGYAIEQVDRVAGAPTATNPNPMPYPASGDYAAANGILPISRYYAVWGPNSQLAPKPKMVRITVALDDPAGTMASEQTYEYVIDVP